MSKAFGFEFYDQEWEPREGGRVVRYKEAIIPLPAHLSCIGFGGDSGQIDLNITLLLRVYGRSVSAVAAYSAGEIDEDDRLFESSLEYAPIAKVRRSPNLWADVDSVIAQAQAVLVERVTAHYRAAVEYAAAGDLRTGRA